MADVQYVARFFIDMAQSQAHHGLGDLMTNLRLQKLLYLAQGWYMARYGKPLFDADIEAWRFGPVVPTVYDAYSGFGRGGIIDISPMDFDVFDEGTLQLLLDVLSKYNDCSTAALVNLSHKADSPWYGKNMHDVIGKEEINAYFSSICPLPCYGSDSSKSFVLIPKRSADGKAVLPADWNDDEDYDYEGL